MDKMLTAKTIPKDTPERIQTKFENFSFFILETISWELGIAHIIKKDPKNNRVNANGLDAILTP